jgi:asparagine synthetase B (glutamine-hydrolysing)
VYSGIHIPDLGNDGEAVLFALASEYAHARALVSGDAFMQEFSQRACALMSRLNGPFAFVLYDQDTQCLWFGRDAVGRRSLLTRTVMLEDCAAFCAASVSPPQPAHTAAAASPLDDGAEASDDSGAAQDQATDMCSTVSDVDSGWVEVAPSGMWWLHLQQHLHCTSIPHAHHIPWITPLPPTLPFGNDNAVAYTDAVLDCLENSVRARALVHSGSCGIGILFSGGLDCMIIAALAARCVAEHTNIDLFNVAFDAAEAPDRESACAGCCSLSLCSSCFDSQRRIRSHLSSGFIELCILFPSIRWRLFAHDVGEHGAHRGLRSRCVDLTHDTVPQRLHSKAITFSP